MSLKTPLHLDVTGPKRGSATPKHNLNLFKNLKIVCKSIMEVMTEGRPLNLASAHSMRTLGKETNHYILVVTSKVITIFSHTLTSLTFDSKSQESTNQFSMHFMLLTHLLNWVTDSSLIDK